MGARFFVTARAAPKDAAAGGCAAACDAAFVVGSTSTKIGNKRAQAMKTTHNLKVFIRSPTTVSSTYKIMIYGFGFGSLESKLTGRIPGAIAR